MFKCKTCMKVVTPKDGLLSCCGHHEKISSVESKERVKTQVISEAIGRQLNSIGGTNGLDMDLVDDMDQ